jgi:hypothetical protein
MKTIALMILMTFVLPVYAEGEKTKKSGKRQEVSFDAQDIDGQVRTPDGAFLNPKKGVKFLPLYKVTNQLDKEIKSSVEFVR